MKPNRRYWLLFAGLICGLLAACSGNAAGGTGEVTTINQDRIFVYPGFPLSDYGFTVNSYFNTDIDRLNSAFVSAIGRSRLFYFAQYSEPAVVLKQPHYAQAIKGLLKRGGTVIFDYCSIDDPETQKFLKGVDVDPPAGLQGGYGKSVPVTTAAAAGHVLLNHPFQIADKAGTQPCYGSWKSWSDKQTALFRLNNDDTRAVLVMQTGVLGKGTVVFNRVLGIFRSDYGSSGKLFRNLFSYVFDTTVKDKVVVPAFKRFVSDKDYTVWHKNPYASFPQEGGAPRKHETSQLEVKAAVNEYVSTAFILTAAPTNPADLKIQVGDLKVSDSKGIIPADRVQIRELQFFHDYTDQWIPDPMPEIDRIVLPQGETRQVWLTINTTGVKPGTYRGQVKLAPKSGDVKSLELIVTVWPIELPLQNPLRFCAWDYVPSENRNQYIGGWENWKHYHRDLVEHGVNVFPIMSFNNPFPVTDAEGNLTKPLDFRLFDAEFFTKDKGHMYLIMSPSAVDVQSREKLGYITPAWEKMFRAWLKAVIAHVKEDLGLGYDQFAFYPYDELHRDRDIPNANREYEIIKEIDPRAKIFLTLGTKGIINFEKIKAVAPHVDIWCIAEDFHRSFLGFRKEQRERIVAFCRKQGGEVWSYENAGRDGELTAYQLYRLKPWGACRLGLGGYGFWAYNVWKGDPWKVFDESGVAKKGAGTERLAVVYSGPRPVSSVRWEALREGMNDVKYLTVLREKLNRAKRDGADSDLIREAEELMNVALKDVTESIENPDLVYQYRERIATMMLRLP